MKRIILAAVAIVTLIVSGVVHGFWTGRWDGDAGKPTPRLDNVALDLADWQGRDVELPNQPRPGITGMIYRRYTHRLTGQTVTMFLVRGRAGEVAIHPPDSCYPAAGYKPQGNVAPFVVKELDSQANHEFKTVLLGRTRLSDQSRLRIFWAWSADGPWIAPNDARLAFPRQPALCKLYLINDQPKPGDKLEDDPCVELMKQLLPEMQRTLFGAGT